MADADSYLFADWPAPPGVRAVTSLRHGGVSRAPYDSFNLAEHVGDDAQAVASNRLRLERDLKLPAPPLWLSQVHGTRVVDARHARPGERADGAVARRPGQVISVMTADCLPVLLCDSAGTRVAALHAGWRGLAAGILEAGIAALAEPGVDVLAWLGPAIGPRAFEVGAEVRTAFLEQDPGAADAFAVYHGDRWLADLYALARRRLQAAGVAQVYGGGRCTYTEKEAFFSYRRDRTCGRMASLIWIE